jgi:uncharacterized protein YbjT (DUF2867 family)
MPDCSSSLGAIKEQKMSEKRTILVTGATGQQGGAVAQALLRRGHAVRALARNPDSAAARALAAKGAEVMAGSFDEPATITTAARGAHAGFLMGNFYEAGFDGETRQGIEAANAMQAAGIGHLIYSSVGSANRATGIPHFESKFRVEQHIRTLGVPFTISAPVAFMENVAAPWAVDSLRAGKMAFMLPPERTLQLVSLHDIGEFAASLVERREGVFGQRFDIAGDEVTGPEQASALTAVVGKPITYQQIPLAVVRQQSEDTAFMAEWFDKVGYSADIAALRRDFPEVGWLRFAEWARQADWSVLDQPQKQT